MDRDRIKAAVEDISGEPDPTLKHLKLASPLLVMKPEDLLVERVLVAVYPQQDAAARGCARVLAAVALGGGLEMDWREVARVAALPGYHNVAECRALVREVADELKVKCPFDTD